MEGGGLREAGERTRHMRKALNVTFRSAKQK